MAAAGHFGKQSATLVRNYAESLGYRYLSASNKGEYIQKVVEFCDPQIGKSPIVFEVFTNQSDEYNALEMMSNLATSATSSAKQAVKKVLGDKGTATLKRLLGKK